MYRYLLTFIVLPAILMVAQSNPASQQRVNIFKKTFVEFQWSNDFIYETDYYYTNGFKFQVIGPWAKNNPINHILISSSKNSIEQFGITIVQDIYTPQEKFDVEKQLDGDRPFSAYILIGFLRGSFDQSQKLKVESEIQIGILGPAALGKETQDGIHDMTYTSSKLNGWENQINNSFALNYSVQINKTIFQKEWINIYGTANGQIGIPYTLLQAAAGLRVGLLNPFPVGFEMFSTATWTTFLFAEAYGRLVGYNATLQGGLFGQSKYTINNINNFIAGYEVGVCARYRLFSLKIGAVYNSPEFPEALSHKWAYVKLQAGF